MIVFDLACAGGHVFEAWFGSGADYEAQRTRGLLSCPLCGSAEVAKAAMAPSLPAKGSASPPGPAAAKALLAELARAQRRLLAGSEHVGRGFAAEARRIHDGEAAERPIHGQATPAEARALLDDGISVAPLPLPVPAPDSTH